MALILHNAGREPLGQFDGLDSQYLLFKGSEICTWVATQSASYGGTDSATADVNNDGYVGTTTKYRPAVTFSVTATSNPLFLADDGIANYGTLFGTVVGGVAGQVSAGTLLGPSTAAGSGKITLWDKMGLYGATLDSVDTVNLVPTNSALTVGSKLSYTATGQLTPLANGTTVGGSAVTVGYLASFETSGSLVKTPQSLVAALNSPSSDVSSVLPLSFYQAVFTFVGA